MRGPMLAATVAAVAFSAVAVLGGCGEQSGGGTAAAQGEAKR